MRHLWIFVLLALAAPPAPAQTKPAAKDTPLGSPQECEEVRRAVEYDSWSGPKGREEGLGKGYVAALKAISKMSRDDRDKFRARVLDCALYGGEDDRKAGLWVVIADNTSRGWDDGFKKGWRSGWKVGWTDGATTQLGEDRKALDNAKPQHGGFWASLALALASRPAAGSPGSLGSTCTEEVGAWPTTFDCGSVTCTREVGAWPATFDCH